MTTPGDHVPACADIAMVIFLFSMRDGGWDACAVRARSSLSAPLFRAASNMLIGASRISFRREAESRKSKKEDKKEKKSKKVTHTRPLGISSHLPACPFHHSCHQTLFFALSSPRFEDAAPLRCGDAARLHPYAWPNIATTRRTKSQKRRRNRKRRKNRKREQRAAAAPAATTMMRGHPSTRR